MDGAPGKYLRVHEAADVLDLAPPTIRWYSLQGRLPAYRVGQGHGPGHRRFRYDDVARLADELGRPLPGDPPKTWPEGARIGREEAARYLGLSTRFLKDAGYLPDAATLSTAELEALEAQIYPGPAEPGQGPGQEDTMRGMHGMHGMGRMGGTGGMGQGRGPRGTGWQTDAAPLDRLDAMDELALRSLKRHLEAAKADIEDQLAEVERRLSPSE